MSISENRQEWPEPRDLVTACTRDGTLPKVWHWSVASVDGEVAIEELLLNIS